LVSIGVTLRRFATAYHPLMRRRLFTLLTMLSLLLCVGTCALWIRSYRVTGTLYCETRQYRPVNERLENAITSNSGRLWVWRSLRIYNAKMYGGAKPPHRLTRRAGPGDRVVIFISDLTGPGEDTIANQPVADDGHIRLPALGPIRAQGRTADLIEEAIHDGYAEAGYIQHANVTVAFADGHETDPPSTSSGRTSSTSWALTQGWPANAPSPPAIFAPPFPPGTGSHWRRLDLEFVSVGQPGFTHFRQEWQISFPHWIVALPCSVLPGFRLLTSTRRRLRKRANCCTTCGYDLRATPDRCPECGTEPKIRASGIGGDKGTV
jgi:Polysaccharide biosynthesis/export protein